MPLLKSSVVTLSSVSSLRDNSNFLLWENEILQYLDSDALSDLKTTIKRERSLYTVYPKPTKTFRAFTYFAPKDTRVVVIGQDPYHTVNTATGLCFEVDKSQKEPPSLDNIYKEMKTDLNVLPHRWGGFHAKQGVLLLNTALTVREHCPGSHARYWKDFSKAVVKVLLSNENPIVFLLWGKLAQAAVQTSEFYSPDDSPHKFLCSAHPSPYSVQRFFGNHHFSLCNAFIEKSGFKPIVW